MEFNIGARVRVADVYPKNVLTPDSEDLSQRGRIGTVRAFEGYGVPYPFRVKLDGSGGDADDRSPELFSADELELVVEETEEEQHLPNITVFEERSIIVHVGPSQRLKLTPAEAEALRVRLGQVL